MSPLDQQRMRQALALAESSFGLTEPNPRVGCVIGHDDGRVFGLGATQQAGGPHAEVMALREARQSGHDVRGGTAWVTLEPCAHHGRTPPCCDALIEAGIARAVVALADPFPQVNGRGLARLRAAGIEVSMADPACAAAARDTNVGFFSRVERGRPWVRLKVAASLDGITALHNGRSQWITGEEARRDGHAWRRRASAVLTGIGTVIADDPRLDVRLVTTAIQPMRAVIDSSWRTPPGSKLLAAPGRVVIFGAMDEQSISPSLRHLGVELVRTPGPADNVDLKGAIEWLAHQGVNELHVEAGARLNAALLKAGLVDELLVYLAPVLLGTGLPMALLGKFEAISDAVTLKFLDATQIGSDLRLRALTKKA